MYLSNKMLYKSHNSINIPKKRFPSEKNERSINILVYGIVVYKHYSSLKKSHRRLFYILEGDSDYLQWLSPKKSYTKARIDLKSIKDITDQLGSDSKLLKKFQKIKNSPNLLFINYRENIKNKIMTLTFENAESKALFWQGLQYLSIQAKEKEACFGDVRKRLAQKLFIDADKNGDKCLNFAEIKNILQKMHMSINHKFLLGFFKKYDKDKNKTIDWEEFKHIIDDISLKPELKIIFNKYCKESQNQELTFQKMSFQEFQKFVKIEQKQDISFIEFVTLINFINSDQNQNLLDLTSNKMSLTQNESNSSLNFLDFCSVIFSKQNEIFEPEKQEVYQNMDHPLTDYYINTSHNTYLMANQFTGESSTKAYINALCMGCRCVELDCWEGDDGEPIIYHGYTLTSKILFRDVIITIKNYAFTINPYPVILSFENHCKEKQQDRISEILVEILGEHLYFLPENFFDCRKFPSPNDLKYKILVKDKAALPRDMFKKAQANMKIDWKKLEKSNFFDCDDNEKYLSTKEKTLKLFKKKSEWGVSQKKFIASTLIRDLDFFQTKNTIRSASLKNSHQKLSWISQASQLSSESNKEKTLKKKNTSPIHSIIREKIKQKGGVRSQNLKKKLALYGIKMNIFLPRTIWNISSIKEANLSKLAKNSPDELQDFTRKFFLRVYPAGTRIDSSNFDPIECFNNGAQMTALNVQTPDLPLLLYMSKFKENGGKESGYVLKPKFMLQDNPIYLKNFTKIRRILCLDVISGQQLRPENENDIRDVVDPYVEVSIRGVSFDEKENSKVYKSKVVQNNGFNPVFNLECQFKICCPELAFIVFKVFDQEIGINDLKIGWNSIPYECMRPGYRIIPLLNSNLDQMEFSCLLCKIVIKDVVPEG